MNLVKLFTSIIPSCIGIIFFLSFSISKSYAARVISITADKQAIFGDEEVTVTASLSGFTSGETIYLKGAFYQEGATNYFGFTKFENNWIKNGDSTGSQRQIIVGNWDQNVINKVDFSDSGYKGEGNYKYKLGFYYMTGSGNISAVNWSSNMLDIAISEPDPTATLIPTKILPSNTPIPSLKPTQTLAPTVKPTIAVYTPRVSLSSSIVASTSQILGSSISATPTNVEVKKNINKKNKNLISFFIPLGGVMLLLISCGIVGFQIYKSKKQL